MWFAKLFQLSFIFANDAVSFKEKYWLISGQIVPLRLALFEKESKCIQGMMISLKIVRDWIFLVDFPPIFTTETSFMIPCLITKISLFQYTENFTIKNENFQIKILIFFIFLLKT